MVYKLAGVCVIICYVAVRAGGCRMPEEVPLQLRGVVNQTTWDKLRRNQTAQLLTSNFRCPYSQQNRRRSNCSISYVGEKTYHGVCHNLLPICVWSGIELGTKVNKFKKDAACISVQAGKKLSRVPNGRIQHAQYMLLMIDNARKLQNPAETRRSCSFNATGIITINGKCMPFPNGQYGCQAGSLTEVSHRDCAAL